MSSRLVFFTLSRESMQPNGCGHFDQKICGFLFFQKFCSLPKTSCAQPRHDCALQISKNNSSLLMCSMEHTVHILPKRPDGVTGATHSVYVTGQMLQSKNALFLACYAASSPDMLALATSIPFLCGGLLKCGGSH
jgi:hypothetical protein